MSGKSGFQPGRQLIGRGNHHRVNSDGIQLHYTKLCTHRVGSFGDAHKRGKSDNEDLLKVTYEEME
jgi:hypothetical protein